MNTLEQKNELSEQGNMITDQMWNVYSTIELISDQQITTSEEPEDELISKRKASTSSSSEANSSEANSEPSQLNNSELNSSSGLNSNESNSNEDINESSSENVNSKKDQNDKLSEIGDEVKEKKEFKPISDQCLKVDELYKKMPTLETLYATVSKNFKQVDHLNHYLNGRNNRLNSKFNRKTSLSARTTPVNQAINGDIQIDDTNRKSFLPNLHNLVNSSILYNSINSPNTTNYYSDADSTISYEAIDYLGSNSIDSGYKSCCPTPDQYSTAAATNLIERTRNNRFSLDASIRSTSSSSFHQYATGIHLNTAGEQQQQTNLNDKFIKHYQELIAKTSAQNNLNNYSIVNGSMIKNNQMMNKNSTLINRNELELINDTIDHSKSINKLNVLNNLLNNQDRLQTQNEQQQSLLNGRTFKSALALKSSNLKLNSIDSSDYCTAGRYRNMNKNLSQSEQYLNNLNDNYLNETIYPYLLNSTKSRHLFKNRSNLNLEKYLEFRIQQQNEQSKQGLEHNVEQLNYNNFTSINQPTKVVKRKLPQINHLLNKRPEMVRNKLYTSKQMHSSDLRLDQYQTNKYEHQARFKSIYIMNNKLKKQHYLSASIEQVSNLDSIYNEIEKCTLSNSLDGEEQAINLINTEYQLKANLMKQKNLLKQVNETLNTFNEVKSNEKSFNDQQLIDKLYSQVQKYQQKSSSSNSIYYQDYLDNQKCVEKNVRNIETTTSLTILTKQEQNCKLLDQELSDTKDQIKNQPTITLNNSNNLNSNLNNLNNNLNNLNNNVNKQFKTKSTDDLYKSMSDLVNNKFQQNDLNKKRAFKLASPLRTLSKAFSSEATDLFKMKELAKSKFVNLIDNFALSTNSAKDKKSSQQVNKSPIRNQAKKSSKFNGSQISSINSNPNNSLNSEQTSGNLYVYNRQISELQKQPLPPIPIEHLYEELKIKETNELKKPDYELSDSNELKQNEFKKIDQTIYQKTKDKKLERQERIDKQEKINPKNDEKIPEIRINYWSKQRSINKECLNSINKETDNLPKQSKSLDERTVKEEDEKLKSHSKSLDQDYEEEIIRKIENVISNIDTMLNNKENLNLEFKKMMLN